MKLKNVLIVVRDLREAVEFYHHLFGLQLLLDQGTTVIMTEGLVLQEMQSWKQALGKECQTGHHMSALYFEETDMEQFLEKLRNYPRSIEFVQEIMTYSWGKQVVRFYDPDRNLIEVATPG